MKDKKFIDINKSLNRAEERERRDIEI